MAVAVNVQLDTPELQAVAGNAASTYLRRSWSDRMAQGTNFVPRGRPSVTVNYLPDICTYAVDFQAAEGLPTDLTFKPFVIEESFTCSAIGGYTQEQLNDMALSEAAAAFSNALARFTMYGPNGVAGFTDLYQSSGGTVATATTATEALALLTDAYEVRTLGQRGMFHVSPATFTRLDAAGLLRRADGHFETLRGHRVAADSGYLGDPVSGTTRLFASNPVYYAATDLRVRGDYTTFDYEHDDIEALVSGVAIVWYDTSSTVAVDLTATTVPAP